MYDRFKYYVLSIPDCGAYIAFPCLYALPRSSRVAFSPFPASLSHLHPLPMHTQKQSIA